MEPSAARMLVVSPLVEVMSPRPPAVMELLKLAAELAHRAPRVAAPGTLEAPVLVSQVHCALGFTLSIEFLLET